MKANFFFLFVILLLTHPAHAIPKGGEQNGQGGAIKRIGYVNAPAGSPTKVIMDIEEKMKSYKTQKPLTAADLDFNSKLKRDIIQSGFDLRELCKRSLDKHWATISAEQQNSFVDIMSKILEKKALFTNEQSRVKGKKYTVNYLGDTMSSANTMAVTKIRIITVDDAQIDLQYRFRKLGSAWKIYDVVVDEASLVDNYRYQFNNIITKHGFGELMNRMNKKLQETAE